jgi:hypothetical protein
VSDLAEKWSDSAMKHDGGCGADRTGGRQSWVHLYSSVLGHSGAALFGRGVALLSRRLGISSTCRIYVAGARGETGVGFCGSPTTYPLLKLLPRMTEGDRPGSRPREPPASPKVTG